MKPLTRHIAPMMFVALLLTSLITGCERKPLYLAQRGNVSLGTAAFELSLDMLWGINWENQLQYPWNDDKHGSLGYSEPLNVRTIVYRLGQDARQSVPVDQHFNYKQKDKRVKLATDEHYDILIYSDGEDEGVTSVIVRDYTNGYGYETNVAVTNGGARFVSYATRQDPEYTQPDQIFGTLIDERYISDDPDDYTMVLDEDGNVSYVDTINTTLMPYTLIYLYQIVVVNNRDMDGNTIIDRASKVTLTGVASSVDLNTRHTGTSLAAVSTEDGDIKPRVADRWFTLPDGTQDTVDILAARLQTWGLPDITPIVEVTRGDGVSVKDSTYILIQPILGNGYTTPQPLQRNVTELMEQHPGGGIITLVIDAAKEIPDSLIYPPVKDGGFDATVNDWDNEVNADLEI